MKRRNGKNLVFDSWAIIAFLKKEPSAGKIQTYFQQSKIAKKRLLFNLLNWGEVYYKVIRDLGLKRALTVVRALDQLPMELVNIDREMVMAASEIKAKGGLSYADCFVVATAKRYNAQVVTGDKEFKKVENFVKVIWI